MSRSGRSRACTSVGEREETSVRELPKHFLADPALSARLVKRSATQLLAGNSPASVVPRDGGFLGRAFEALAALSVRTFAQNCDARVFHLRTKGGRHEVDFVVEGEDGVIGIEVKLAGAVGHKDVRECVQMVV